MLTIAVAMLSGLGILDLRPVATDAVADAGPSQSRNRPVIDPPDTAETPMPTPTENLGGTGSSTPRETTPTTTPTPDHEPLPAGSGHGKRVVYSLAMNYVWLVNQNDQVVRSYLVSGTRFGQVRPGDYTVINRLRYTTSYHGTEKMEYMVTFTRGENAAIGFHSIPIRLSDGEPLQTKDQLGQSLSDGCVRQAKADAAALWDFAPMRTPVIVLP